MNWLSDNYKWLFDGVAGAAVIALIGWLFRRFKSERPSVSLKTAPSAAAVPSKSPAVTTEPNLQYAGYRSKQVFVSPSPQEGISDPSDDHEQDKALEAVVLKFENRLLNDRKIARALNVIARLRFRSPDGLTERLIDHGVWLNSPCNSTDIGIGDTCELVLLCVLENELLAFDDRRSGNRFFPSNFSYLETANVQGLETVEITIIDQNTQSNLTCNLRVLRQGSTFCVA